MLAGYRANADSLLFFQQLGIQAVPALGYPGGAGYNPRRLFSLTV